MFQWYVRQPLQVRVAILVAPILAIGGWGLMDTWKRPETVQQEIQKVAMYQLVAESQCLLATGECKLGYEGVKLTLAQVPASHSDLVRLDVKSNQLIRGLKMAIVQNGVEEQLIAQSTALSDAWFVEFPQTVLKGSAFDIRLAVAQTKRMLLAEFPAQL